MAAIDDKFTEVDRSHTWKVTKVHEDGKVDMINTYKCTIYKVDSNTKNYHFAYMGQNQFIPYNPTFRYEIESKGMRTEQVKTKGEAKEWADLLQESGEVFSVTDRANDKIVFSSQAA